MAINTILSFVSYINLVVWWNCRGLQKEERRNLLSRGHAGYVSDYAELIEADWQNRIRLVCKELEDRTGIEMIVVAIETANPYSHTRRQNMQRDCIRNGISARPNRSGACCCSLR